MWALDVLASATEAATDAEAADRCTGATVLAVDEEEEEGAAVDDEEEEEDAAAETPPAIRECARVCCADMPAAGGPAGTAAVGG